MAKAKPTKLGAIKRQDVYTGGDKHTFIRCKKCEAKYVAEQNPKGCPAGCDKRKPKAE